MIDWFSMNTWILHNFQLPCIMWLAIYKPRRFSLSWWANWVRYNPTLYIFLIRNLICGRELFDSMIHSFALFLELSWWLLHPLEHWGWLYSTPRATNSSRRELTSHSDRCNERIIEQKRMKFGDWDHADRALIESKANRQMLFPRLYR